MRHSLTACAAMVLAALGTMTAQPSRATANDQQEVETATAEFYTALNTLFTGDVEPMNKVWSHADDITYMGPNGGVRVGWDKIGPTWKAQADKKLGGKVEPKDLHFFVGQDLAVVTCYEKGENMVDGKTEKVSIRATSTFRKEEGQWKMIGHHTDLLPFLEKK